MTSPCCWCSAESTDESMNSTTRKVCRNSLLAQVDADFEKRSESTCWSVDYVVDSYAIWHACSWTTPKPSSLLLYVAWKYDSRNKALVQIDRYVAPYIESSILTWNQVRQLSDFFGRTQFKTLLHCDSILRKFVAKIRKKNDRHRGP